nr:uncharacterized protein LOC117982583 [Maniola hyperantus]
MTEKLKKLGISCTGCTNMFHKRIFPCDKSKVYQENCTIFVPYVSQNVHSSTLQLNQSCTEEARLGMLHTVCLDTALLGDSAEFGYPWVIHCRVSILINYLIVKVKCSPYTVQVQNAHVPFLLYGSTGMSKDRMVVTRGQAGEEKGPGHEMDEMRTEDAPTISGTMEQRTRPEDEPSTEGGQTTAPTGLGKQRLDLPSVSRLPAPEQTAVMKKPCQRATKEGVRITETENLEPLREGIRQPPLSTPPASLQSEATAMSKQEADWAFEEGRLEIEKRYEIELLRKRLARRVSTFNGEDAAGDGPNTEAAPTAPVLRRVQEWLNQTEQRQGAPPEVGAVASPANVEVSRRHETRTAVHLPVRTKPDRKVEWDQPRILPTCSPHPAPAEEQPKTDIDRLAASINKVANRRPLLRELTELPKFSGEANEWNGFKIAMMHSTEHFKFSAIENVTRLRNSLQGKARDAVSSLLNSRDPDPERIMRSLDSTFGRPDAIARQAVVKIRKLKAPTTAMELEDFSIALTNIIAALREADIRREHLFNPQLVVEVLNKLDEITRSRFAPYAHEYGGIGEPEILVLTRFIELDAEQRMKHLAYNFNTNSHSSETFSRGARYTSRGRGASATKRVYFAAKATAKQHPAKPSCVACGGEHHLPTCPRLITKDIGDRWKFAREAQVCFQCLRANHRREGCKASRCGVNGCQQPHHHLLHKNTRAVGGAATASVMNTMASQSTVLLKICPVTIRGPKGTLDTYALLDEGSTITLVDGKVAAVVGAEGPTRKLKLHGINAVSDEISSQTVGLLIKSRSGSQFDEITARTVPKLELQSQAVPACVLGYPHLKGLKVSDVCYYGAVPRILIGADNGHLIVTRTLREGSREAPKACLTSLGWVIMGPNPGAKDEPREAVHHLHHRSQNSEDEALHGLVKSHFDLDALGVSLAKKEKPENERAVELFKVTARRNGPRFEVGLTWRSNKVRMPPSFFNAFKRLKGIEKKMDRDAAFGEGYMEQVGNLLQKGYATECSGTEEEECNAWFLPHFGVRNPNKPGKLRLVFDAAACSQGVSLNDMLLEGPDLLQSLPGILYRFREEPVAVTADIQEMFLQIKVRSEDQPSQMFLWRGNNRSEPPKRYKMTSLIFGATCSPFLAHSVRNLNAEEFRETHPAAFAAITTSHYMDDFVDSFPSKEEAIKAVQEVDYVHQQASFILRDWSSNEQGILNSFPVELRSRAHTQLMIGKESEERTLGLVWDAQQDELGFNTRMPRVPKEVKETVRAPSKRETLSAVMSIYDPLGFLSPYTIVAKIMLQSLWRLDIGWDEPIPKEQAGEFVTWMQGLHNIEQLRLPRCYDKHKEGQKRHLHIFCDASELAYAAVAYWQIEGPEDAVIVRLASAKAKVAPLRGMSIPRMELQAAVIGARLAEAVKSGHRWEAASTTFWSDSRTVLIWVRTNAKRYTPFVAHRLGEIAELTKPEQWRWVPTKSNPADDATRSEYAAGPRSEWLEGPQFLQQPSSEWPKEPTPEQREPEEEVLVYHVSQSRPLHWDAMPDINRISKWNVLIGATARVIYIAAKWRKMSKQLEVRDLQMAEKLWLERAQVDSFASEIQLLKRGEKIPRSSRLYKLDPEYGSDRLLRLRGRINAAPVTQDQKQPIILDGRHQLTRMLIQKEHEAAGHAGNERVVNDLRQRYWILQLRPSVRAVAHSCQQCRIRKAAPQVPTFGDLPAARLAPFSRPFQNVGVDYFGPMSITIGRRHEKRWCALFTCLTTRAVHLELVYSLSTDSAIQALRRMGGRRGWPSIIFSDNATNFKGADVELRAAVEEWAEPLREFCLGKMISWKFITPGTPNQGGAWERLVRSVKTALSATLNEKSPKEETLQTLLVEAEYSVNARPLTHVSVSHKDPEALTPNHFLIGSSSRLPVVGPCQQADKRTWRAAQALADEFWRRWIREYLPTLVPRGSAAQSLRQLQQGDLVVVVDDKLPRNVWPRGIIEQVYPGPDGEVRCADIRTSGGVFRRPTRKLAVLPIIEGAAAPT